MIVIIRQIAFKKLVMYVITGCLKRSKKFFKNLMKYDYVDIFIPILFQCFARLSLRSSKFFSDLLP